ncbi:histidine kinase [Sulfodiicoccus acidiphilus]|uniref:Histidine kinase n=2 Tax=Sulfodiicoccus acidiphilus TaxID=1670455 RepID=A0A348B236_9CREN|nr:histidine kinase [Sulfodiicoccus acidiphilus]GGT90870.1 histidine kinase [Sulfodiicoccus acidiphilus]
MSSPALVTSTDTPLKDVVKLMWDEKVGSVLVVDEEGKLVGIVTERDVVYAASRALIEKGRASSVMAKNVISVGPEEPLMEAVEKMRSHNISHLPVVEGGRPVGVVSMRDLTGVASSLLKVLLSIEET